MALLKDCFLIVTGASPPSPNTGSTRLLTITLIEKVNIHLQKLLLASLMRSSNLLLTVAAICAAE